MWAYRTTTRRSTEETPFALTFRVKVVISVEISVPSYREGNFISTLNNEKLILELDLVEKLRNDASIKNVAYQDKVRRYYNARVKSRKFNISDLVVRKALSPILDPLKRELRAN